MGRKDIRDAPVENINAEQGENDKRGVNLSYWMLVCSWALCRGTHLHQHKDRRPCQSWHTILQPPQGSELIEKPSWVSRAAVPRPWTADPQTLRWGLQLWNSAQWTRAKAQCVVYACIELGLFESRAMTAEGEACVRHVCFAFSPWAQLCALSFSQNTGTQQTPSPLAPPSSNPSARAGGPPVHIVKEILSVLRYAVQSGLCYAYALDLERRVKLEVIWTTAEWSALLTGYSLHSTAPNPRQAVNVVPFRELSMVSMPEGVLQGFRFTHRIQAFVMLQA